MSYTYTECDKPELQIIVEEIQTIISDMFKSASRHRGRFDAEDSESINIWWMYARLEELVEIIKFEDSGISVDDIKAIKRNVEIRNKERERSGCRRTF